MSYRDELEAAHARSEALERELADARAEIAELKGESESTALVRAGSTALARPDDKKPAKVLRYERTFDGALADDALAEIAEYLTDSTLQRTGELTALSGSVMWKGAWGNYQHIVRVSSRRGVVTVKMETNIVGMGAGAGVVGGIGGLATSGVLAGVAAAVALPPVMGLAALIPFSWWAKRRLHRRWYRKAIARNEERFAKLVAMVERLIEPVEDKGDEEEGGD